MLLTTDSGDGPASSSSVKQNRYNSCTNCKNNHTSFSCIYKMFSEEPLQFYLKVLDRIPRFLIESLGVPQWHFEGSAKNLWIFGFSKEPSRKPQNSCKTHTICHVTFLRELGGFSEGHSGLSPQRQTEGSSGHFYFVYSADE